MRRKRTNWLNDRRTGVQIVSEWAETFPSQAEAAAALGMTRQGLWGWLNDPDRGWDKDTCREIAPIIGCPVIALLFKNEPVSSLLRNDAAHRGQDLARAKAQGKPGGRLANGADREAVA